MNSDRLGANSYYKQPGACPEAAYDLTAAGEAAATSHQLSLLNTEQFSNFCQLPASTAKRTANNWGENGATEKVEAKENGVKSIAQGETSRSLRVLMVEDSEDDSLLLLRELRRGGYELTFERVDTAPAMNTMLDRHPWDVILADYSLPQFSALEALRLIEQKGLDQPFIIICDQISEENAILAMKAGAHDYVMKHNLARLLPALERELREAQHRRESASVQAALRASEGQLRAVFDGALDAMAIVNNQGEYVEVNQAACNFFGLTKEELEGRSISDFLVPSCNFGQSWQSFREKGQATGELRLLLPDGTTRDVEYSVTANLLTGLHLAVLHDITERKQAEDQLLYHAFYDPLTGLPNRAWFLNCLGRSIRQAKRSVGHLFAVLLLDLDRYQIVKYSFGHLVADQLLIATARRIGACLSPKDMIARLGGDEFAILLSDLQDVSQAKDVADRLHQEISWPFHLNECELFSTASIGIAPSSLGFDQPEDFLRAADTAMHHAKKLGGARSAVFETAMHTRALALLQLETDLRRALERQELRVHYQPVVSLLTGQITGFEALVRWVHPERGFVSPMEFISVAEDTGLIIPLGAWVMQESCRQLREWQFSHSHFAPALESLTISVNLSCVQFTQPGLISQIDRILRDTGLNARCLKLEITETAIMEAADGATELLLQLKERQIQVCVDDFGTGYSSLSRLQRLPIDTLKIDKSFVSRMGASSETESLRSTPIEIVRTCIALAHNLGMDVIAEGVETIPQLGILRSLGCEYGQGYLFSKPVDGVVASSLLLSNPRW